MLDRKSWEHHTTNLREGRGVRVEHDCGEGRVLKVTNGDDGYSAWCFRCNDKGFIPHPAPSLSERLAKLARTRAVEAKVTSTVELPTPAVLDPQLWPTAARLWLYKAGFSNDDIQKSGFYFCPPLNRVVLPVIGVGNVPLYWQARALTPDHVPKYINPFIDKSNVAYKCGVGLGDCIVLTEDILSAARVGRVCESWSILGTSLTDGVAAQLAGCGLPIVVMLDPDGAGRKGSTAAARRLRSTGLRVSIAHPHRDPKYLTKQEITECIKQSWQQ